MFEASAGEFRNFKNRIIDETSSKIRSFLYELAEGTSNYKSLHNLTEQVEHQYHGRFLIELLQNAHDALKHKLEHGELSRIEIILDPDDGQFGALYVANDGNKFSESNFRSLSQLGQSDKNPQESIGNKGIGFRSVLEITTSPEIYSRSAANSDSFDGFCFSFCPTIIGKYGEPIVRLYHGEDNVLSPLGTETTLVDWGPEILDKLRKSVRSKGPSWLSDELKYLSPYLLPFPVGPSPDNYIVQNFQKRGFVTVIRLPFKNDYSRELAQKKLEAMDANTILFLNHADSLVLDSGSVRRELHRKQSSGVTGAHNGLEIVIQDSSEANSRRYWFWNETIKVEEASDDLRNSLLELPGKWPELQEAVISLAVRLGDIPEKGVFSIFLPTDLPTGCAAHISAPFFGDMSRTDIDFENEYNSYLLHAAATKAVEIVHSDLKSHGLDEARAIIDLLAPLPEEKLAGTRWSEHLNSVFGSQQINLCQEKIALTASGWNSFECTSLIPTIVGPAFISEELFRKHACFPAFVPGMSGREKLLKSFFDVIDIAPYPSLSQKANTIESIAKEVHKTGNKTDWNVFWADTIRIFDGESTPLKGKEILLGTDNSLHASGEQCSVFFTPRQGSLDDEEVLSEGALHEIPSGLKSYVAFLHDDIQVYNEQDARMQTPIRKFLDTKLVQRFRVEDILNSVLIRRTPKLPILSKNTDSELCQDIILWGLSLVSSLVDRGKGEKTLRLLNSLPVPCRGGWYELRDVCFGPGWQGTLGSHTLDYLQGANNADCKEAVKRLLVSPKNKRWGAGGEKHQQLLSDAGVFDGLKLPIISSQIWGSRFGASYHDFHLPEDCPSGVSQELFDEYSAYVDKKIRLTYTGYFDYEMQEFSVIPGLEEYADFDELTRKSFMHIVLGSIARWKQSWSQVNFKKVEGQSYHATLLSPAFYALSRLPWLGIENDESIEWSKASDRWYIPCARLSGRPRLFAHLKPLPGRLAQQLDSNPLLADALLKLGMPKFDTESKSDSDRLLNDLATALSGEITDPNVFLGQVRDAWGAFEPEEDSAFPAKLIIRHGNNPVTVHIPSVEQPVYLPDSSASFIDALQQFSLPVIAIDTSDAKRLSEGFKVFYGDGIQLASNLQMKPLVNGEPWVEVKNGLLEDSELEWIIPLVLSMVAFTGIQAKGTNSDPFQKRVQMFREARLRWVPNLEAGLFRGGEIVVNPSVPALWLDKEKVLLVTEESRDRPYLLSEALAFLIQRDDLELPIKFALKEISDCDPDPEDIKQALLQLKISEDQYLEAREQWRGDLGPLIRMIRPMVMLLAPGVDIGRLVDLETEESVVFFLNDLHLQDFDGVEILKMARLSRNSSILGESFWTVYGEKAQLVHWNSMLEQLGEPLQRNINAVSELRSHIVSTYQPLCSLIADILRESPEIGQFKELSGKLNEIECPDVYAEDFWEVDFNLAIREVVTMFEDLGASHSQLEAIRSSTSPEDLRVKLDFSGVDTSFDPFQASKFNRDNLNRTLQTFQRIGLAWCLNQNNSNTTPWEVGADQLNDHFSEVFDGLGYLSVWNDDYVLGLLKLLPRHDSHAVFWQKVDAASNINVLLSDLGLTSKDLDEAQAKLDDFKEQIRRKNKLVAVCGHEFDSSENNLSSLWSHIHEGITDETLSAFAVINLQKIAGLKPVESKKKKPGGGNGGGGKKPAQERLTQSMKNLIGLSGEIHAYRLLQQTYGTSVVHHGTWVSGNSSFVFPDNEVNDGRGCDFVILHKGKTFCIEVKASQGDDESFKLGSSEIRLAMELSKRRRKRNDVFQILHVTNALSENPSFKLLPNPYDPNYQSYFDVVDADARVRYRHP